MKDIARNNYWSPKVVHMTNEETGGRVKMAIADLKYKALLKEVLDEGEWDTDGKVRPVYADGTPAYSKSIFGVQVKFKQGELPIITSKHTPVQSSINEVIHAFFRLKVNRIEDFEKLGINYWKEWGMSDHTIGRSYAYQLKNQKEAVLFNGKQHLLDQVDNILYNLKHNPYSRRIMFAYWNPEDVNRKSLQECAWAGQFNVRNNRLDFNLIQRSVDSLLGLPTNWAGYYGLQCALANIFDYDIGTFTHQMGNVHLYDNQLELAEKVLNAPEYEQPKLWVNPKIKNFYDYGVNDILLKNYKHGEKIRSGVAI